MARDVPPHVEKVIEELHPGLKRAHERVIDELRRSAEEGRKVIIFADTDADGASAHGFADVVRHLGVKDVEVHNVSRDDVRFGEPATYVVYDITVTPKHLEDVHPEARIINIDHHDLKGGFPEHQQLLVIANPFYTDRPGKNLTREENNHLYPYNPSVQLLNIAKEAGYDPEKVALLSAIGAFGDMAHRYSETIRNFVHREAERYGLSEDDLREIASAFELPERFPGQITTQEIVEKYVNAVRSGDPRILLRDEKVRQLMTQWEETLQKYLKRLKDEKYLEKHTKIVDVNNRKVRLVVVHVDPEDERRIQKIKSAIGSTLKEIFDKDETPTVVAAGQWESHEKFGDVLNYRIGVNKAGLDIGLHAGEIARALAGKFNMRGGGHPPIAGAIIPYYEKERAVEHLAEAVKKVLLSS